MHLYKICRGAFRRFHEYFSIKADKQHLRSEIRNIIRILDVPPLTDSQRKEIKDYYAQFGVNKVYDGWHRLATHISGNFYKEYIPQDLFYALIEPKLNMNNMLGITDKNLIDRILSDVVMPKTVIKCINGLYYDGSNQEIIEKKNVARVLNKFSKLIIKPSLDSYGGKNVIVFKLEKGITDYQNKSLEELISSYGRNFIIQELIQQHEDLNRLNPTSVNSLRLRSIIINNEVKILNGVIRIGGEGSFVDNTSQGGLYCGIREPGFLFPHAYDGKWNTFYETSSGVKFEGFTIPNYTEAIRMIKDCHIQLPHFRLISWDVSINIDGEPVLIEYNVNGQGFWQNYGPYFTPYTDDVMKLCFNKD